jgi:hypothetical protein
VMPTFEVACTQKHGAVSSPYPVQQVVDNGRRRYRI